VYSILAMKVKKPESIEECDYFLKEFLYPRGSAEPKGKFFAWVFKGENRANIEYICPYCGYVGYIQLDSKRPPYKWRCENCGKQLVGDRIKKTVKKLSKKMK